jgi:hypothetical protein
MTIPGEMRSAPSSPSSPSSPGEAAQSVASTATDEGRAVVETAKSETGRLASEARAEMRKQGDEQTRRMADRVRDVGDQLERVQRGEAPEGPVANVLVEFGSRANQFADRLQSGGIDEVTRDVKRFARQRPGVFLAGAFALGVVAGRTLRNADTHALAEAAKPSGDSAGAIPEPAPWSGSETTSAAHPR